MTETIGLIISIIISVSGAILMVAGFLIMDKHKKEQRNREKYDRKGNL